MLKLLAYCIHPTCEIRVKVGQSEYSQVAPDYLHCNYPAKVNYRIQPGWGSEAKNLTPDGRGVDHVIANGGPTTLEESINAARRDGLITANGMVAGLKDTGPEVMSVLWRLYIIRGVLLGSKDMMQDMIKWFKEQPVAPTLDNVVFGLEDAKGAYDRLQKQKHFSKVIIRIE